MSKTISYRCKTCGAEAKANGKMKQAPECCDTPMEEIEELSACRISSTAEHSRFDHTDDPCDDGRSGKV